jgi:hypothetical protein
VKVPESAAEAAGAMLANEAVVMTMALKTVRVLFIATIINA